MMVSVLHKGKYGLLDFKENSTIMDSFKHRYPPPNKKIPDHPRTIRNLNEMPLICRNRFHGYQFTPPVSVEFHQPVGRSEYCIIAAQTDVSAGMKLRAALPDDDTSCIDKLAGRSLNAPHLRFRIAAVSG